MMNVRTKEIKGLVFLVLVCFQKSFGYVDPFFYRATTLFKEPRLERPWLTSLDFVIGGGRARHSIDGDKHEQPLFDLFGAHNMQELANGVCTSFNDPIDLAMINLSLVPARKDFATLSFGAKLSLIEGLVSVTQNFDYGLFLEFNIPVRSYNVHDIDIVDLTPEDDEYPNNNHPAWLYFNEKLDAIFSKYQISIEPVKKTGVGDVSLHLGWTYSHQETQELDFIDMTMKIGLLAPSAARKDIDQVFALPLGYEKHWGFPFNGIVSFGAYDWLTWGVGFQGVAFLRNSSEMRLKTGLGQSGMIKLAKDTVKVAPGMIWLAHAFLKGDHVVRGLSFGFGYTYATQKKTYLTPYDVINFSYGIINSDESLAGFAMHTVHAYAEYDFTEQDWRYGPRVGLHYSCPVSGHRIMKTFLIQASCGLEIVWDY